ncbi:cholesterol 25-hydroxylase-like protein [Mercenaria mercenaria]|uniref:cholesterol 25-hydroxylase-like protein n=1 Tax=Mercenaria mercenaria TaxID=6596 RepID=UPI00234EB88F|nr:cholesterol 25-hydroxylase-like protein [Mercenaria mercenaria]
MVWCEEDKMMRYRDGLGKPPGDEAGTPREYRGQTFVIAARCFLVFVSLTAMFNYDRLQFCINSSYSYLLSTYLFNSVYFETLFTTFCYTIIMIYPWLVNKFRCLDSYKIIPNVKYQDVSVVEILKMLLIYMTPLMLLDTFMVKKYHGVDPSVWIDKRSTFIQSTRALPALPPSAVSIVIQLAASFIFYDALFFTIHFTLHKNFFLYKYIHKQHHEHGVVHSHITNKLTIIERITLVLTANFALKVFDSHPFTRMIFIPIFVGILIDNHAGYDMPFGLHRLVPFGLVGGSVKHFAHHQNGNGNYQPIFTYLDRLLKLYNYQRL